MKEIILSENCFGIDVEVDGESLFVHEYDNRDVKQINKLKEDLISKLLELKDNLGMSDWETIAEIVTRTSNDFEYDVDNSIEFEHCSQCGNYNHKYVYKKVEDEKES
jgi:hypothetical protein